MLPNCEVLLADYNNNRLKKLDSSYKVRNHCDVTEEPYSVCYIGNNTAVASLGRYTIQYVNVSGKISLIQLMKLDHECFDIACHGDTLYVRSGDTIYKYDKNCGQKHVLYHYRNILPMLYRASIAISDNGERLYFWTNTGLTTIDANGNLISSQFVEYDVSDICIAGESIVLVLDAKNIFHQWDYNGKNTFHQLDYAGIKHQTINNMPINLLLPPSMCFDRERCRIIAGGNEDHIYVNKCEFLPC
jgi:hypothetical protein